MEWKSSLLLAALCYLHVGCIDGYVEAVSASVDASRARSEKQVAMICDKGGARYHNQYMDDTGHWITDLEHNKGCLKRKSDILEYCGLVYPDSDFASTVESTHSHLIENWCKVGHKKCKEALWVKPYRCLADDVGSDSLSVPDSCRFDRILNESLCLDFNGWSRVSNQSCKDYGMILDSVLARQPCGAEVYNGVEFVCCPGGKKKASSHFGKKSVAQAPASEMYTEEIPSQPDSGDEGSTRDPYFTKFDPRIEHDAFKAAERRLETAHRRKITKIMKEWTELEERYQKIKDKNPLKADKFKLKMTERFNRMMNALKDQGSAEKHQLIDLHQQRIIAHINERKKDGMKCFVKSLNEQPPSSGSVRRCLSHLVRALYKDRHHTISHYNHLVLTNPSSAQAQQAATVEHLHDIQRMVNESVQMLDRYPDIKAAILPDITRLSMELRGQQSTPAELVYHATDEDTASAPVATGAEDATWTSDDANRIDIDVEVERRPQALAERRLEPVVAHVQAHEHVHGEATYRVLGAVPAAGSGRSMYVTVALASLALTVALVAGAVALRRRQRAPHRQGFTEVDQAVTPEERHLAQMQVNGYENPTYRYFESK